MVVTPSEYYRNIHSDKIVIKILKVENRLITALCISGETNGFWKSKRVNSFTIDINSWIKINYKESAKRNITWL